MRSAPVSAERRGNSDYSRRMDVKYAAQTFRREKFQYAYSV